MKVCAIVVTYNRKKLLIECLKGILKQTRPVDAIYIIDNASTDGTPELLLKEGYIRELPPANISEPWEHEHELENHVNGEAVKLFYVRMHENTGGAGGFHEGLKRAYEKGYDWFWLMDDDVEPLRHALETQLRYKDISECIHPSKVYLDGSRFLWEGQICEQTGFEVFFGDEFLKNKEWTTVNFGCFEGMLISRNVVAKISYPDKRLFILGDDTYYGYLVSKHTNNIYISSVCFIKKIDKRFATHSRLSFYLYGRNIIGYVARKIARDKFAYLLVATYKLFRHSMGILIKRKGLIKVYDLWRGYIDGLLERWGREREYFKR